MFGLFNKMTIESCGEDLEKKDDNEGEYLEKKDDNEGEDLEKKDGNEGEDLEKKYEKETGFDPKLSGAGDHRVAEFIRSRLSGDLTEVPGIALCNQKILRVNGISTTFQLIALFLSLKEEDTDGVELCDKFWYSLQAIKINSNRNTIVQCIAEKVNTWVPGVYDYDSYN